MEKKVIHFVSLLFFINQAIAQSPGGVSSNLHAWWKADAGVTGSPVTAWTDQSGNAYNLSSSSGPTVINNDINYNPSLLFDGSSDFMQVTNGIFGTSTYNDMFVFVVNKTNTVKTSSIFFETLSGGDRFGSHLTWSDQNVYYDIGNCCGSSRINVNWGSATGNYHIWTLASSTGISTPSGTRKAIYRDALVLQTNNNNDNGTGTNNNFYLGSSNGSSSFHSGNISEMVIYQGVPTSPEMQRIHSYLGIKYGITIDQSTATAYVSSSGASIYASGSGGLHDSYDNDIAGIGRDDNSGLDQRISKSINSGTRIIMDKGAAFSSDEDFIVWGHDGNSTSTTTTGAHPSYNYKLQRTWRADLTGSPGSCSVRFLLGSGIVNSGIASDYAILIDGTDTDFSTGATAHTTGASINGDTLMFTGVNFSDGDFFTLGTEFNLPVPGNYSTNVLTWWKADEGVTGATPVTAWADQSGGGNNLSTSSGPDLVASNINYNPSMNFDGSSEFLSHTGGILGTSTYNDMMVMIINRGNTNQASSVFRESLSGGDRFGSHLTWSDNNVYYDYGTCCGSGRVSGAWGTSNGIYHLWTLSASTSTSTPTGTRKAIHRDGQELTTNNNSDSGTGNGSTFYLGSTNGSGSFHAGNVAEVIIWASNPSATELQRIHSYFGLKYGLTLGSDNDNDASSFEAPNEDGINEGDYLSSSGTVIWDASLSTSSHNNVIGIGRDDNSDLLQKQSQTSDDTTRVYLSTLEIDNASNTGSFSGDAEFLLVGDNEGAMCLTLASISEMPAGVNSRIEREWKVTNTNFNGSFSIDWQLNSCADISSISSSDLRLLVDSDGDFSNAVAFGVGSGLSFSNSSGRVTVSGISSTQISVNSTVYITLGSISPGTPLPIELIDFTANVGELNLVELAWQTASEINNDYFTIERSLNARNWEEVDRIDGAGNSNKVLSYTYTDDSPYSGTSYYRLKQTDFDGQYSYSPIRAVKIDSEGDVNIEIYPNPTNDKIYVVGNLSGLKLYNVYGRDVTALTSISYENNSKITIDLTPLKAGLYYLRMGDYSYKIYKVE